MKNKMSPFFFLSVLLVVQSVSAESMDESLRKQLDFFNVKKYDLLPIDSSDEHQSKINLGRRLFIETKISGNRNVSCRTCHHPMLGTSDALALSQTEDSKGVLRRNSSHLFNVGDQFNTFMFWDGRVHYNPKEKIFTTPESALNGESPKAGHITKVMKSALAAQALFPLLSHEEMRGKKGDNEIADAATNLEAWDRIIKRVTTEDGREQYLNLFKRAYPSEAEMNIGHVGEAMATFMRFQFQSTTSPFHRYLAGDDSAMSVAQKRGLLIFINEGRCIACHQGSLLGNNSFFTSVGVPSFGAKPFEMDRGRKEVTNEVFKNLFFKTPSLINLSLTAPYMHNGAFKTIREVLNHYNNIDESLRNFTLSSERRAEFPVEIEQRNSPKDVDEIWKSIQARFLKMGLGLTQKQLDDLEIFLTEALTDPKWVPQKN